jgi:DNA-directed RNA polymerase subunit RPC12/RpoP
MYVTIRGLEDITFEQIRHEVLLGAKFVRYPYCVSPILMTFRHSSDIFFIKPEKSAILAGLPYLLLSLVLGWWGIPYGPIYTIQSLYHSFRGGKDVTEDTLAYLRNPPPPFYDVCPGCTNFAFERAVCMKYATPLAAIPRTFIEQCAGKDFERIPLLLRKMHCFACGATVTLSGAEQKSLSFSCPRCGHKYDFNTVTVIDSYEGVGGVQTIVREIGA